MRLLIFWSLLVNPLSATEKTFELPDNFTIDLFADASKADDIYSMTIDPKGRVTVAGRGYIRILIDADQDGQAETVRQFSDRPGNGAQGLCWVGNALYAVGDQGVYRFVDSDGDDQADGPPELLAHLKTGGEHDAHAIRRGPDGWFYVLCGNMTGINAQFVTTTKSPIAQPTAGCLVRFSPDFTHREIVADGFRNAYDFDFDAHGEVFAYDSDNERCVGLPWYEPTRFYHVLPGGNHGWRSPQFASTWRYPPYLLDIVTPVATLERGSPTGVVCYQGKAFPEAYQGGFFAADWTFGQIWYVPSTSALAESVEPVRFLQAKGSNGFAPTDLAVHPNNGSLFVSIGGRGTRGGVFQIRYRGSDSPKVAPSVTGTKQAMQSLQAVRGSDVTKDWQTLIDAADANSPSMRLTAMLRVRQLNSSQVNQLAKSLRTRRQQLTYAMAVAPTRTKVALGIARDVLRDDSTCADDTLTAVRIFQLALGDIGAAQHKGEVWEGYSAGKAVDAKVRAELLPLLQRKFPSEDPNLNRELSRTLAMLRDDSPATVETIVGRWNEMSDPLDDLHELIVLGQLRGERTLRTTQQTATTLLSLDRKLDAGSHTRDRNWPLRIREMIDALYAQDPNLPAVLVQHREFGRPSHVLLVQGSKWNRAEAARGFLRVAQVDPDFAWNAGIIRLVARLPEAESRAVLDELWELGGWQDVLIPLFGKNPKPEDRDRFVEGLRSWNPGTVATSIEGLRNYPVGDVAVEGVALLTALRRLPDEKGKSSTRKAIVDRLHRLNAAVPSDDPSAWEAWLRQEYPEAAKRLPDSGRIDRAAWTKRLAQIDWEAGQAESGEHLARKLNCLTCHGRAGRMGPDLAGVTKRFSRADLFTAILEPNRDIAPRYRATEIMTHRGTIQQGMIVYAAVDGTLLQLSTGEMIRIPGEEIAETRRSTVSLMPAGLLEGRSDQDLADLYAWMRTLGQSD